MLFLAKKKKLKSLALDLFSYFDIFLFFSLPSQAREKFVSYKPPKKVHKTHWPPSRSYRKEWKWTDWKMNRPRAQRRGEKKKNRKKYALLFSSLLLNQTAISFLQESLKVTRSSWQYTFLFKFLSCTRTGTLWSCAVLCVSLIFLLYYFSTTLISLTHSSSSLLAAIHSLLLWRLAVQQQSVSEWMRWRNPDETKKTSRYGDVRSLRTQSSVEFFLRFDMFFFFAREGKTANILWTIQFISDFRFETNKSTKGASKLRRDLINTEIANLRDLLPLPQSTRQRLSQLQLMALVCVYVRKANYFQQGKCK